MNTEQEAAGKPAEGAIGSTGLTWHCECGEINMLSKTECFRCNKRRPFDDREAEARREQGIADLAERQAPSLSGGDPKAFGYCWKCGAALRALDYFCADCGAGRPNNGLPILKPADGKLTPFPVAATVLLHCLNVILTCGCLGIIWAIVWTGLHHGRLPYRRRDDPDAGKAIGYFFIPIYWYYWAFFSQCRLGERIDEARVWAGLPERGIKSYASMAWAGYVVLKTISLLTLLTGEGGLVFYIAVMVIVELIVFPIYLAAFQMAVNEIACADVERASG